MQTQKDYVRPGQADVPLFARDDFAVLAGGGLAGLIAAIPMVIVAGAIGYLLTKNPILDPVVRIASTAFGEGIVHERATPGVVIVGAILHLLVGMGFGVIFGTLVDRIVGVTPLVAGIVYSFVVFLLMFFYVVPNVAPALANETTSTVALVLAHLVYGVGLGLLTPLFQRVLMGDRTWHRRRGRGRDLRPIPLPVVRHATP